VLPDRGLIGAVERMEEAVRGERARRAEQLPPECREPVTLRSEHGALLGGPLVIPDGSRLRSTVGAAR